MDDLFAAVDDAVEAGSRGETLHMLAREFRDIGRYDLLFEARSMAKRLELGLPLIQTEPSSSFPEPLRTVYEETIVAAAREAGELYLRAGNIPGAYRYLRAIGEVSPVAQAIEQSEPGEDLEDVIAIAFQEGVHPLKGLQLILSHHGMCRAITAFGMQGVDKNRQECLTLLVKALHGETVQRMSRVIEEQEGTPPVATSLPELMEGRDWLFGDYDYYVDTSHLTSLIPYCLEATDLETLSLLGQLCEYGRRLSPNFAYRAQPPFENGYEDYGHYIKAVLGRDVDDHLRHFYEKAAMSDPEEGTEAAQLLVSLLSRLNRHDEALAVFSRYLSAENPSYLRCPGALQLCYTASNYDRLRETARDRGDVLSYAAARLLSAREHAQAGD